MSTDTYRFGRLMVALMVLSLHGPSFGPVSAQTDDVSAIDGNTYTSPTFEYTVSWDDHVWQVSLEYASSTFDYLALQSTGATVSIELIYSYLGNVDTCMIWERHRVAQDQGLTEIAPVLDSSGIPSEASGEGWAQGFYAMPVSDQDATLANIIYLECRSIVPGSAVMIVTGYIDPADSVAQGEAILGISDAIEPGSNGVPPLDLTQFENGIWQTADNLDAFWAHIFAGRGLDYSPPNYQLVTFPVEIDCGIGPMEESRTFYCPLDDTIYLDLEQTMNEELFVSGTAAVDLVLGHEVGHHVQNMLGLSGCSENGCGPDTVLVDIELQADCLSGVWMQDAVASGYVDPPSQYRTEAGIKNHQEQLGESSGNYGSGEEHLASFMAGYEDGASACGIE